MKQIITILSFFLCLFVNAQEKAKYSGQGMKFQYTVLVQDSQNYVVLTMTSEEQVFAQQPTLMLKTFEGDVITLVGEIVDSNKTTAGVMISGIMFPVSERTFVAQFSISNEEIELLSKGICKVRLATVPKLHEKEFKKDKIGLKLYTMFQDAWKQQNNF
jgi:hypothetical protein